MLKRYVKSAKWICPDCQTPIGYLSWTLENVCGVGPLLRHDCSKNNERRRRSMPLVKKELSAKQIMEAFQKHERQLVAQKSHSCAHISGLQGEERLYVMNQGVLLRHMLLELGFTDENMGR